MKNKIYNIILAFIACLFFTINHKLEFVLLKFPVVENTNILKVPTIVAIIVFAAMYYLFNKIKNEKIHTSKIILSIVFSTSLIIGNSLRDLKSLEYIYGSFGNFILTIIYFFGLYQFFKRIFIYLGKIKYKQFECLDNYEVKNKTINKFLKEFDKNPVIISILIIICFWSIYIIAFYPIVMSPDPLVQVLQYYNMPNKYSDSVIKIDENVNLTNHHPVLYTMILGNCINIGEKILNQNFGLFLYSLLQIILMTTTFGYSIKFLKEVGVSIQIRILVLAIYSITPMFPLYAMSAIKDTIYTCFILIFMMFLYKFIHSENKKFKIKFWDLALFILDSILIILYRNNGIYVIVISLILTIILNRMHRKSLFVILIGIICFYSIFNNYVLTSLKITKGSIREALSIPIQQVASLVINCEKELEIEEKKLIDKILGIENIKQNYNPEKSDYVKDNFNKNTTNEELNKFFRVWFKYLLKHPVIYLEATLNNMYGYFYPDDINWYIYFDWTEKDYIDWEIEKIIDYKINQNFRNIRIMLSKLGSTFQNIPVIGLISNIGFNTWILLFICSEYVENKKNRKMIYLMPCLVSLLVCVASPVNTYFRYAMPIVFLMPVFVSVYMQDILNTRKNDLHKGVDTKLNK